MLAVGTLVNSETMSKLTVMLPGCRVRSLDIGGKLVRVPDVVNCIPY